MQRDFEQFFPIQAVELSFAGKKELLRSVIDAILLFII